MPAPDKTKEGKNSHNKTNKNISLQFISIFTMKNTHKKYTRIIQNIRQSCLP